MDLRPIGVFDSGLGGLSMVKALTGLLPFEDIVYLGDTGRVPYGQRSCETIMKYADQDAAFLTSLGIKAMVIACNTVCTVAYDRLKEAYGIPIYEVVRTPAKIASQASKAGKIGVIGTSATIRSGAYERALGELSGGIRVYSKACPLFVPLAEEGWTQPDNEVAISTARRYLQELCEKEIDTLILGCTHYSLLTDVIAKVMGRSVTLIDSGAETAKYVALCISENEMHSGKSAHGEIKYYVTDSAENFCAGASRFLESDIKGQVEQITLE